MRSAAPSLEEGRTFAHYLDQAAEGFFRFLLGRRSVDIIAAAFLQPGHDLSHHYVSFAEHEKAVVGMVSGYTAEQHRHASDKPLREAAGAFNLRMITISILFAPLFRIIDTVADGDFYLQSMAVDKNLRGQGIGSMLLDFAENKALTAGAKRLALDVSAGNKNARSLYENRGMAVESQWPKRLHLPGLKFYRMTKTL